MVGAIGRLRTRATILMRLLEAYAFFARRLACQVCQLKGR